MFFADPTPFLKALVKSVMDFVTENTGASNLTVDILGTMFKVCLKLCVVEPSDVPEVKDFTIDDETKLFVIRVMVGLVVLYDHVNEPNGAFNKGKIYVMIALSYAIERQLLFFNFVCFKECYFTSSGFSKKTKLYKQNFGLDTI